MRTVSDLHSGLQWFHMEGGEEMNDPGNIWGGCLPKGYHLHKEDKEGVGGETAGEKKKMEEMLRREDWNK